MRIDEHHHAGADDREFLSIQAQDFIEEKTLCRENSTLSTFLSIQAQDFIEEASRIPKAPTSYHS